MHLTRKKAFSNNNTWSQKFTLLRTPPLLTVYRTLYRVPLSGQGTWPTPMRWIWQLKVRRTVTTPSSRPLWRARMHPPWALILPLKGKHSRDATWLSRWAGWIGSPREPRTSKWTMSPSEGAPKSHPLMVSSVEWSQSTSGVLQSKGSRKGCCQRYQSSSQMPYLSIRIRGDFPCSRGSRH